jgi:hypothetical protein
VQERRAWGKGAYLYTDVGDASGEMQCGEMQWRDASDASKWRDANTIQVEPVHTTPSFNMYLVKINTIMISALKHLY